MIVLVMLYTINISQDIECYAAQGMRDKPEEFAEHGNQLYLPLVETQPTGG